MFLFMLRLILFQNGKLSDKKAVKSFVFQDKRRQKISQLFCQIIYRSETILGVYKYEYVFFNKMYRKEIFSSTQCF